MGKTSEATLERVIGGFPKSRRMVVEARLLRERGALLADVRVYAATDNGRLVPTRAGLRLRADQLPSLAKLIEDARAAAEGLGGGVESGPDGAEKGGAKNPA